MALLEARSGFRMAGKKGARGLLVKPGDRYDEKSKIVKANPGAFQAIEETSQKVFTATAAPGVDKPKPTDVSSYHVGGGWYQIGDEKVQGEDAARALLEA